MAGSPNYGGFIYDGDGSATPESGPNGSAVAEKVFEDFFERQNFVTLPTAFGECYHSARDNITNLNNQALDEMSDSFAHSVLTFAQTTSSVNGTEKGSIIPTSNFEYKGSNLQE